MFHRLKKLTSRRLYFKAFLYSLVFTLTSFSQSLFADNEKTHLRVPINDSKLTMNLNPFHGLHADLVRGTFYEPLVVFNSYTSEVHYRLAESYEYSNDLKSITYVLRKNLTWSDGKPLTADDVVYSFNLAKKHLKSADIGSLWRNGTLKTVRKVNDRTVVFKFKRANTTAQWVIPKYYIVPKHVWSKVKDIEKFENIDKPVGSGPITEIDLVENTKIRMCKNPYYYRDNEPYIDCIEYKAIQGEGAIRDALTNDELDWAASFIEDVSKNYAAKDPEHFHFWYPPADLINLYFNTRKQPLSNIDFRRAISMALDRETIINLAAYDYPILDQSVVGIGLYYKTHFDESLNKKYSYLTQYNPERAQFLLDQAGYYDVDGDGFRELPNGKPLSFKIMTMSGWTEWEQSILMVTEYLSDIGINAQSLPVDWVTYDKSLKTGDYDMVMNWSLSAEDPILTYTEYYHSSRLGQSWQAGHGLNSKKLDKWINDYSLTQHKPTRAILLKRLMKFTADNLPFIPLWSNPTWFQFNSKHIVGWPTPDDAYVRPWFPDAGNKLILFSRLKPRNS